MGYRTGHVEVQDRPCCVGGGTGQAMLRRWGTGQAMLREEKYFSYYYGAEGWVGGGEVGVEEGRGGNVHCKKIFYISIIIYF